jgi:hypothetical protein
LCLFKPRFWRKKYELWDRLFPPSHSAVIFFQYWHRKMMPVLRNCLDHYDLGVIRGKDKGLDNFCFNFGQKWGSSSSLPHPDWVCSLFGPLSNTDQDQCVSRGGPFISVHCQSLECLQFCIFILSWCSAQSKGKIYIASKLQILEIWVFHGDDNGDYCLQGCGTVFDITMSNVCSIRVGDRGRRFPWKVCALLPYCTVSQPRNLHSLLISQ